MAQSLGTPDLGNFPGGPVAKTLCSQHRGAPVHFLDPTRLGNFPDGPVAETLLPTQGGPGSLPRPHTPRELPWWSSG